MREDGYLLAAVTEHWPRTRPQKLSQLLADYDWLNRTLPTYDELSFGLARLVAAGYVRVRKAPKSGITVRSTADGSRLGREARQGARSLNNPSSKMARLLGCKPWPDEEAHDPSGGRLKGLDEADFEKATREYEMWFERMQRQIEMLGPAITAGMKVIAPIVERWRGR